MKKIFLLLFILASYFVNSQVTLYQNTFLTSNNLADWDNEDLTGNNPTNGVFKQYTSTSTSMPFPTAATGYAFFQSSTINAAGTAYEDDGKPENAALSLKNSFSTLGQSKVFLQFYQYHGHLTSVNNRTFVEISTNNTTWTTVYTDSFYSEDGSTPTLVDISSAAGNQASVYIRFRYKGSFSGIWRIDDLKVYAPNQYDIQNLFISSDVYKPLGQQVFKFWVRNLGSETITSIKTDLFVDGAVHNTFDITSLSIPPLEYKEVTLNSDWNPTSGFYKVSTITKELNGTNVDNIQSNNASTTQDIVVYSNATTKRIPLYEVFSSSTCGPCAAGNANFKSIIDTSDKTTFSNVKYQQGYPGTGDPYCTVETIARAAFYSIGSIPRMEIDGAWDGNASDFTGEIHNAQRALPSIVELSGTYSLDKESKKITIKTSMKPLMNLPANKVKLFIAIKESVTNKNIKSNGEKEFHDVVKKMLPSDAGIGIEIIKASASKSDSVTNYETSFSIPGVYRLPSDGTAANRINLDTANTVENFDNLSVVVWVQTTDTKFVLQSSTLKLVAAPAEITDSVRVTISKVSTATTTDVDIKKHYTQLAGKGYAWRYISHTIPATWEFLSICDNFSCITPPFNKNVNKYTAKGKTEEDILKVTIKHNKKVGYGYVYCVNYDEADSAKTAIKTKFALMTTESSSIAINMKENDKLLYYFDNTMFVDNDFRNGTLNIVDLNGKTIYSSNIQSSNIRLNIPTKGIYIANVVTEGKVAKSIKFSAE